jgi:hypothetical protein
MLKKFRRIFYVFDGFFLGKKLTSNDLLWGSVMEVRIGPHNNFFGYFQNGLKPFLCYVKISYATKVIE